MRVCVLVPMYNEEAIVKISIETILNYIRQLPSIFTLLIVNDGSQDATGKIVKQMSKQIGDKNQLQMISHNVNKGYGAALKTGIKYATDNNYDYVIFMDSDLTDHPRYIRNFYDKMIEGYDYIKTTRHTRGGGFIDVPWKRRLISRLGNIFAKMVTGLPLTDITNGFRAVKVDILKQLELTENHFSIIIEEIMKARKITNNFCEIPRMQKNRSTEARESKFSYDFPTLWKYTKYLFL